MGNIPGGASPSTGSWFSGRTTPSGVLTPGSALSRSTASRLGVVPALAIPSNLFHEHRTPEYDMGYPGSTAVSPSTPIVLSSLIRSSGVGSGPGTASNGGSVPLTPTTDDAAHFEYHTFSHHSFPRVNGYDGAHGDDEDEDEDEDERMTMAAPSHIGGSPRRGSGGVGVTRTAKKRRSTTIAAGPSAAAAAAVGITRSRSGTMVGGVGVGVPGLVPTNGLSGGSLTMSPVDMHGAPGPAMGLGPLGGASGGGNASANGTPMMAMAMGGQANSPLAMKELSPTHKPLIENYLNRYLNYLCMNRACFLFFFFFSFSLFPTFLFHPHYHLITRFFSFFDHCYRFPLFSWRIATPSLTIQCYLVIAGQTRSNHSSISICLLPPLCASS